jgi:hypothetical protein
MCLDVDLYREEGSLMTVAAAVAVVEAADIHSKPDLHQTPS